MISKTQNLKEKATIVFLALKTLLATVFLLSAFFKLQSFYEFNLFLLNLLSLSETMAYLLSLALIVFEFFLGFQLLFKSNIKIYLQVSTYLLILFSIFNIIILFLEGNSENCFCFGNYLKFTPLESLIKNLVLLGMVCVLKPSQEKIKWDFMDDVLVLSALLIFSFYSFQESKNYFVDVEVQTISIPEAKKQKDAIFIDAREARFFKYYHIENAINIPFREAGLSKEEIAFIEDRKEKLFIVYCDNAKCGLAHSIAMQIREYFQDLNLFYLKGGVEEWIKY